MNELNDFYNAILNIRDKDYSEIIQQIVFKYKKEILEKTSDLTGFCKYMANQIECDLKQIGVKTYYIDLNFINVDHVFLIAEYKYQGKIQRILIDPTYVQFLKKSKEKLIKFEKWPSEIIKTDTLFQLIEKGMFSLNEHNFNNYLECFGNKQNFDLSEFLLKNRLR